MNNQDKLNRIEDLLPILTALIALIVYCLTMAPGIVEIDSGELAAVQVTGGVAHPTGYPLFTFLGWVFTLIPISNKVLLLNFQALLYTVAGVFFFTKAAQEYLKSIKTFSRTKKKGKKKEVVQEESVPVAINLISIASGALFLAFSRTFWIQSTSTEVYSLHICLLGLTLWLLIRAWLSPDDAVKPWLFVAGGLALMFANHMSSILILPGIAVLYFWKFRQKEIRLQIVLLAKMLAVFFPLLILNYLWLPFRASADAGLNWGDPDSWEFFYRHISGSQFQVWAFNSKEAAGENFKEYWSNFPMEFAVAGMLLAAIGFWTSVKNHKVFAVFCTVSFIFNILFSINYDIKDLEPYFLLSYFITAIWIVIGVRYLILTYLKDKLKASLLVIIPVATLVLSLGVNFTHCDASERYLIEDYSRALMKSLPEDAIIISRQWDFFIAATYYYQHVEGKYKNVAVIDRELLRRSWYYQQLEQNWPELMDKVKSEIETFKKEVQPFERDEKYNARTLDAAFKNVIKMIIEKNIVERPVFVTPELVENEIQNGEMDVPKGYTLISHEYCYQIVKQGSYAPIELSEDKIRFQDKSDYYTDYLKNQIPAMLGNRAYYELSAGKKEAANLTVQKIQSDYPYFNIPQELLNP